MRTVMRWAIGVCVLVPLGVAGGCWTGFDFPVIDDLDCGKARQIKGFSLKYADEEYWLPSYVKIEKGGRVLFEDDSTVAWDPPYRQVDYGTFGNYLLLKTAMTDCIDLDRQRLFMITPEGEVIHQEAWTGNHRGGFFVENGEMKYWSEWFCPAVRDEPSGEAYIYVFSESQREFVKMQVPDSMYCGADRQLEYVKFLPCEEIPK